MSRDIYDLDPKMRVLAERFIDSCDDANFDVLIYNTYRSPEEQAILYRQGRQIQTIDRKVKQLRVTYGRGDLADILVNVGPQWEKRVVTYAGPGQSLHNYGLAFDGVPMCSGKPVWGTKSEDDKAAWATYGAIAEEAGLEWAGRWTRFKEHPHCQAPGKNWRKLIKYGRTE